MPTISRAFNLNKVQSELDFVDVPLQTDTRLFIDPFALSQRVDRWSIEAHATVVAFFQAIIDLIRGDHDQEALELLFHLREPNETRLGFSRRRPKGAGVGHMQAEQLFAALTNSTAVRTGFIHSLQECELMVDGIGRDKISDLTTNIIRRHLVLYTQDQCLLHGIAMDQVPLPPWFDPQQTRWVDEYNNLPVHHGKPILMVPKAIVRLFPAYQPGRYYTHFVLNFLQES